MEIFFKMRSSILSHSPNSQQKLPSKNDSKYCQRLEIARDNVSKNILVLKVGVKQVAKDDDIVLSLVSIDHHF